MCVDWQRTLSALRTYLLITSYTATHHSGSKGLRQNCKHPATITASLFSRNISHDGNDEIKWKTDTDNHNLVLYFEVHGRRNGGNSDSSNSYSTNSGIPHTGACRTARTPRYCKHIFVFVFVFGGMLQIFRWEAQRSTGFVDSLLKRLRVDF